LVQPYNIFQINSNRYYSGLAKAPVLTVVIGGNHEASNYMLELFHGIYSFTAKHYRLLQKKKTTHTHTHTHIGTKTQVSSIQIFG
jgi:hypothetical protein